MAEELVFAIREVLKGRMYVSPSVAENLVEQASIPARRSHPPTPPHQDGLVCASEVLQLIAEGSQRRRLRRP